jgi:xanthine/uracil permease
MKKQYIIVFIAAGAAAWIYGILTDQIMVALVLFAIIICAAIGAYLYPRLKEPAREGDWNDDPWSAIIVAAIVAGFCVMIHAEFLLWAVALAALFLIQQSLARIEKRLETLEKE